MQLLPFIDCILLRFTTLNLPLLIHVYGSVVWFTFAVCLPVAYVCCLCSVCDVLRCYTDSRTPGYCGFVYRDSGCTLFFYRTHTLRTPYVWFICVCYRLQLPVGYGFHTPHICVLLRFCGLLRVHARTAHAQFGLPSYCVCLRYAARTPRLAVCLPVGSRYYTVNAVTLLIFYWFALRRTVGSLLRCVTDYRYFAFCVSRAFPLVRLVAFTFCHTGLVCLRLRFTAGYVYRSVTTFPTLLPVGYCFRLRLRGLVTPFCATLPAFG